MDYGATEAAASWQQVGRCGQARVEGRPRAGDGCGGCRRSAVQWRAVAAVCGGGGESCGGGGGGGGDDGDDDGGATEAAAGTAAAEVTCGGSHTVRFL